MENITLPHFARPSEVSPHKVILRCDECASERECYRSQIVGATPRVHAPNGLYRCADCVIKARRAGFFKVSPRIPRVALRCTKCGNEREIRATERGNYAEIYICLECRKSAPKAPRRPRLHRGEVSCPTCHKVRAVKYAVRDAKGRDCPDCSRDKQTTEKRRRFKDHSGVLTCAVCGQQRRVKKAYIGSYGDRNGVYMCMPCRHKHGRMGELNSAWKGGVSFAPYPPGWTKALRASIRERDGHRCSICAKPWTEGERLFPVHHINYDKQDVGHENLITCCLGCHSKTNYQRDSWQSRLEAFVRAGGVSGTQLTLLEYESVESSNEERGVARAM